MPPEKLSLDFYRHEDVVQVSRNLIGKVLCTRIGDYPLTSGIITETEAYSGRNDKACHAHLGRRTDRTEIMYHAGGKAYVYLCYGIHNLFNIVTNRDGLADAVLVRAIKPVDGINAMMDRRNISKNKPALTAGPGRLTEALGITREHYGTELDGDTIWLEDRGIEVGDDRIEATPRIGIDYAEEDADLPWRFILADSKWVS
ncbi:MAG: DNA-3-methyladenine glycosylase [Balneolaceae bacterium]|nr:DNA-3-methyladenine glycosylase [Balneolaceae bacterium]